MRVKGCRGWEMKKTFEEEIAEISQKIANRPSNCKYCGLKICGEKVEYICERTEKQTFLGTITEKCCGDCKHYRKDFPEMFRDMILSGIKRKIKTGQWNHHTLKQTIICKHG